MVTILERGRGRRPSRPEGMEVAKSMRGAVHPSSSVRSGAAAAESWRGIKNQGNEVNVVGGNRNEPRLSRLLLAVLIKWVRVLLSVLWVLVGYLFEGLAVTLTVLVAMLDVSIAGAMACCGGKSARSQVLDFPFTAAYANWLQNTLAIAFETVEGRSRRTKALSAEKVERRRVYEEIVTKGLLRGAAAHSLDVASLDPATSQLAFVFTDIEGSTQAQLLDPHGYQEAVLKHDEVIRDALYSNAGTELDTEGDAFRIAFGDVAQAVRFAMDAQRSLLQVSWSKRVRKIRPFRRQKDPSGVVIFAGPRVRMGIHLAKPGEFDMKQHRVFMTPVVTGEGWRLAHLLSECGAGGQVLASDAVCTAIQGRLAECSFPVVRHLGAFALGGEGGTATDVFEVTEGESALLRRKHGELRRCERLAGPSVLGVPRPPEGEVAFVAVRAAVGDADTVVGVARCWQGFCLEGDRELGREVVAFKGIGDAVRFAIALQATLLLTDPGQGNEAGPAAVAIHVSNLSGSRAVLDCLLGVTQAGQTLLSQPAFLGLRPLLASVGHPIVIDMGVHSHPNLGERHQVSLLLLAVLLGSDPVLLCSHQVFEIAPRALKGRGMVFGDLPGTECLSPGARQSPPAPTGVAFVFTEVAAAVSEGAAAAAVAVFVDHTRKVLVQKTGSSFFGYECQEVGAGNFMLAFSTMDLALSYCSQVRPFLSAPPKKKRIAGPSMLTRPILFVPKPNPKVQEYLLAYPWPAEVLSLKGFEEVVDGEGRIVHRGPRVMMGVGYGVPFYSMPHPNTGSKSPPPRCPSQF